MELMDKEGRRLAHLAAMRNHHMVLEFLYENGFELQCPDNRKRLPIHLAAKHGGTCESLSRYNSAQRHFMYLS